MVRRAGPLVALIGAQMLWAASPSPADKFAREQRHLTRYRAAQADLNGDWRAELLIYAEGPDHCGSGGCDLYILTPRGGEYKEFARVSVTRPPVRLLPTTSHGWRDLAMSVAGGGILPGYTARLRFDGRRYPTNPTVPPAEPMSRPAGRVLIGD